MVVVCSPALNRCACVGQAGEPMQIQAVLPELAIEAFQEGIPGGFSGLDKVLSHAGSPGPEEHGLGGELRAIVEDQCLGQWPDGAGLIEMPSGARAGDGRVDDLTDILAGEVVD